MTQDQAILLAFKVVEVASVITIAAFVALYTWWTRGKCWSNPIGQTIVYKDIALVLVLVPSLLSIFVNFNRLTSHIAAWFDVGSFALVPVIMVWRVVAWRRIHKAGKLNGGNGESAEDSEHSPLYCSLDVSAPAASQRRRGARPGKRSSMAKGTCSIEGCGKRIAAYGWCDTHYRRWRKHGDPLFVATRQRRWPEVCSIGGCGGKANEPGAARGLCRKHYMRWQRHGDPLAGASCAGCGAPIMLNENYAFCMRRKCRRLFRAARKAEDPERYRAMAAASRARQDKAKQRAAWARYKARTDRKCRQPGCGEFALQGYADCRQHQRERHARRYERIKLRLPLRLYQRQAGRCPDASHGGCGLPLGDAAGNHVDHLIPITLGGPDDDWNLQLMHPECNLSKLDSLVPAATSAAAAHGLTLSPNSARKRTIPSCLLP